jgi:hypothetical protein
MQEPRICCEKAWQFAVVLASDASLKRNAGGHAVFIYHL